MHFFITSRDISGNVITLSGETAAHLRGPRRVRIGERLVFVADSTDAHVAEVTAVERDVVRARIVTTRRAPRAPRVSVHVLQAVPAQGMELAVELLTIAGAASIVPVLTNRTVRQPRAGAIERWRRIAREAAQLSERAAPPDLLDAQPLAKAIATLPPRCLILAAMIDAAVPVTQIQDIAGPVAVVVGPEGGFDADDRAVLDGAATTAVHLGPRVLPSRLAGAFAVQLVLAAAGDLETVRALEDLT